MWISDRFHLVKNLNDRATLALQKLFQGRISIPATHATQSIRYEILIGTVADRIHLVKKLRSAGRGKRELCVLTGLSERVVKKYIDMPECDIPKDKPTVRGREHEDAVRKLLERAQRVRVLRDSGLSRVEIAQKIGFTLAVVERYLSADFSPV